MAKEEDHEKAVLVKKNAKYVNTGEDLNPDDVCKSSDQPEKKSFYEFTTTKQKWILFNIVFLRFFENVCSSLPAPFLARVIDRKGGYLFETAIVLQIKAISAIIFTPIFGHFLSKGRARNMVVYSLMVLGLCQSGFSFLSFLDSNQWFTAVGATIRFIYGSARAGFVVGSNVLICAEFPHHVSFVYGLSQGFSFSGYLAGPSIGGVLFDKFGMFWPVLITGFFLASFVPLQCILLPDPSNNSHEDENVEFNMKELLLNPAAATMLLLIFSYTGILTYADVALTMYFKDLHLSSTAAGIGLGLWGASSSIFSVLVGYISGKNLVFRRYSGSIAGILCSCTMLLFSPQQKLAVIYFGCFIIGVFASMVYVPCFEELLFIVNGENGRSNSAAVSKITGVLYVYHGLGSFVIPEIASVIQSVTSASFSFIFYGIGILNFIISAFQFAFSFFQKRLK